jgi:MFS family permease
MWGCVACIFAILITTIPLILRDAHGPKGAASWVGNLTAVTAVFGLTLCGSLGYLSDRIGRITLVRAWLLAFVGSVALVLYAQLTGDMRALVVARAAPLSVPMMLVLALTSDLAAGPALFRVHGHVNASFAVSMLVGSLVSAGLGYIATRTEVLVVALLIAIFVACFAQTIRVAPHAPKEVHANYAEAMKVVRDDPLLLLLVVAFALFRVGHVNFFFMIVVFTNYRLGWGIVDASLMFGFINGCNALWQTYGVKHAMRFGRQHTVAMLLVILAAYPLSMVLVGSATTTAGMMAAGVATTFSALPISILTSKIATLSNELGIAGTALGVVGALQNILEVANALFFGRLLAWAIATYEPTELMLGIPFFLNAFVLAGTFIVVLYADRKYGATRDAWRNDLDKDDAA